MAEKRTTTPALMTQVTRVGLTLETESVRLARRDFFDGEAWADERSLELVLRFCFGAEEEAFDDPPGADPGLFSRRLGPAVWSSVDGPEARGSSALLSSPIATDSGTRRKVEGWAAAGLRSCG